MARTEKLTQLLETYWFKRQWDKAKAAPKTFCLAWAAAHDVTPYAEYHKVTTMLFLDGAIYEFDGVRYARHDFTTAEVGMICEILTSL